MPDWTAITGIIVSGVVGPSVGAGFAIWRQRVDHAHERERDDLVDVRVLLDEVSQELRRAAELAEAVAIVHNEQGRDNLFSAYPDTVNEFRSVGRDLDVSNERMVLRFGVDSAIVRSHDRVCEGVGMVGAAIRIIAAPPELGELLIGEDDGRRGAEVGLTAIGQGQATFRAAALELAGARLPGRTAGPVDA